MEVSLFLAKCFCLYFVVMGVALLLKRSYYQSASMKYINDEPLLMFSGVITLILGIVLVVSHSVWMMGWPVIISILSWVTFIKGVMLVCYPEYLKKSAAYFNNDKLLIGNAVMMILLGLYLGCKAWY